MFQSTESHPVTVLLDIPLIPGMIWRTVLPLVLLTLHNNTGNSCSSLHKTTYHKASALQQWCWQGYQLQDVWKCNASHQLKVGKTKQIVSNTHTQWALQANDTDIRQCFLKESSNPRQLLRTYKRQLSSSYFFYTKVSSIVLPGPSQLNACESWKHSPAPWCQGEFNQKTNCFHFSIMKTSNCCGNYQGKKCLPATKSKREWLVLFLGRKLP